MYINRKVFNLLSVLTTLGIALVQLPCQAQTDAELEAQSESMTKSCMQYQAKNPAVGSLSYIEQEGKGKTYKLTCFFEKTTVSLDEIGKVLSK